MSVHQRVGILERLVDKLKIEHERLARLIAFEAAKPIRTARAEVSRAIGTWRSPIRH